MLALTLLLLCSSVLATEPDRKVRMVAERAARLMPGTTGFLCVMPKRAEIAKTVGQTTDGIGYAKSKKQALIIYCPDPEFGSRVIRLAFAMVKPRSLSGMVVVCAVGKERDGYIRSVVEATGAKLYVEPVP